MKTIKTKTQLLLALGMILFLFALPSCQKYEEGPLISFRSAYNRLYGNYQLISYTVDGIDSLSQYKDSLGNNFRFFWEKDENHSYLFIDGYRQDNKPGEVWCKFGLKNNETVLFIDPWFGNIGTGPFGYNKLSEWTILRLTNKGSKMKTTYNGKEYIIELE